MVNSRVNISEIVENQLPAFVTEEFPLVSEFLSQYYKSLEIPGGPSDILNNIDRYAKIDNIKDVSESTNLIGDIDLFDTSILVASTIGFPDKYGIIQIDNEIITYKSKTDNSFEECIRGFSGVTDLNGKNDKLIFSTSNSDSHSDGSSILNLSALFLNEFLYKLKKQIAPGFEGVPLNENVNEKLFIKQVKDFYSSKGSDKSFAILFNALYGEKVQVLRPSDNVISPSASKYRRSQQLVVECDNRDILNLVGKTIYQNKINSSNQSFATVLDAEEIKRGDKTYYKISLDNDYTRDINISSGTIYGNFIVSPKTKVTSNITKNSTFITVDSTIGFPNEGELLIKLSDGTIKLISYYDRNINQFLECSGITFDIPSGSDVEDSNYCYGYDLNNNKIEFKITSVISDSILLNPTGGYSKNDPVIIDNIGLSGNRAVHTSWLYNNSIYYNIKNITLVDSSNFSYSITLYDDSYIYVGDSLVLYDTKGNKNDLKVTSLNNKRSLVVESQQGAIDLTGSYYVERQISYVNTGDSFIDQVTSNVTNVYYDFYQGDNYITSNSLPSYSNLTLDIKNYSVSFSGDYDGEELEIGAHPFLTGDAVYYIPQSSSNTLNIDFGLYYVTTISSSKIKLSRSKSAIYVNKFINLIGNVTNSTIVLEKFYDNNFVPYKLLKKIPELQKRDSLDFYETQPNQNTGILINGVEILNYKSSDSVYYGEIESVDILDGGNDYNVVNPPTLIITDKNDPQRSTNDFAEGYVGVAGSLTGIKLIDPGFDYIDTPIVDIVGGGGKGALVRAELASFKHEELFKSEDSNNVNLSTNVITFSDDHKFRDYEKVIYRAFNQTAIGGLIDNSIYYIKTLNAKSITIHNIELDAISGINTVNITSYGTGKHSIESYSTKKKIQRFVIENNGEGYKNRLIQATSSGISTISNNITINNHGYETGEVVVYNASETPISGLTSASSYYVTKIDDNEFKLSSVGVGTTASNYYINNGEYVNFSSIGSGVHYFNYPPIEARITGKIGISTLSGQDFNAVISPIITGNVTSIFVANGGDYYGSEEILNYNRQPSYSLESGRGAQLFPIVSNGAIIGVNIQNSGSNYDDSPVIVIYSLTGSGAILTPVVENGSIVDVNVINGGYGYIKGETTLQVSTLGGKCQLKFNSKKWTVNNVEKLIKKDTITQDDGILEKNNSLGRSLQYYHLYAPRNLRKTILGSKVLDGETIYLPDLSLVNSKEIETTYHSPIIGWAYDGNPIYGPYGYETSTGGSVKLIKSGYVSSLKSKRPSVNLYPEGFFVEDYDFVDSGDLDQHNGRYTITPEYPNGIYAYFATISDGQVETSGPFTNYKKPSFPYIIGNTYKHTPSEDNFGNTLSLQNFDTENIVRYTNHYNLESETSGYNYILNPNKIKPIYNFVKDVSSNNVTDILVPFSGSEYKVGDTVNFNDEEIYGKVRSITGREVSNIFYKSQKINNVEIISTQDPYGNFVGFCTSPHNLIDKQPIFFSGIGTNTFNLNANQFFEIRTKNNVLFLSSGVPDTSVTGIVTYFDVYGPLSYPNITTNDVYSIRDEKIKILEVDKISSRIKVYRAYDGTVGLAYTTGESLTENTRKFYINLPQNNSTNNLKTNKEYYFTPSESVGLGTIGVGSTLTIANPGIGASQVFAPIRSIYIPNHQIENGTRLIYNSNGGSGLDVSLDGISNYNLTDGSEVYVVTLSNDFIGISTSIVGLGSTGNYIGITSTNNLMYFISNGSGTNHSFKTNYNNIKPFQIKNGSVVVSLASTHNMRVNDSLDLFVKNIGITTTVKVKYNDYNRRILIGNYEFSNLDINPISDTITIANHRFTTGQKVVYTSNSPSINLINNKIYYINVVDEDNIRLCDSYYESLSLDPNYVNIGSASTGEIGLVNPLLKLQTGRNTIFDLSDSSLSYNVGSRLYSAFKLNFYVDNQFKDEYEFTTQPEIIQYGNVGIDTTARIELQFSDPTVLYYKVNPINLDKISQTKKDILIDSENVPNNNAVLINYSDYSGEYSINKVGIGSTNFECYLPLTPEESIYTNDGNTNILYVTSSKTESGGIYKIQPYSTKNFKSLPSISSIDSNAGEDSLIYPIGLNIGIPRKIEINDIGFGFPSDTTLKPQFKLPQIIFISPLGKLEYIRKLTPGINYTTDPKLILVDPINNTVLNDVELQYSSSENYVSIVKNTNSITGSSIKVVPTNNTNGIPIISINYNSTTKDVIVGLGVSYSTLTDFPFEINDTFIIENVSVGVGTTGKGYNSSNYNYTPFIVKSRDPNIGGSNSSITFNINEFISGDETPGTFYPLLSNGLVIPEKYFPTFEVKIEKGSYRIGEYITNGKIKSKVIDIDKENDRLKVISKDNFNIDDQIYGEITNTKSKIVYVENSNGYYNLNSSGLVIDGWQDKIGFLNDNTQRIHDSDYYQYFSYSLKSKVEYDDWNSYVSSLNHTSGYKKFSDLQMESTSDSTNSDLFVSVISEEISGISVDAFSDIVEVVDLNCIVDFDLASEKTIKIGSTDISNEVIFNSRDLQDYFESIGNRVLIFDDVSPRFNNTPRSTPFSIVDSFRLENERFKKYITYVRDQRFIGERQFSIISMMYDSFDSYLNQYGRIDTARNLGSFDFVISGDEGKLLFYPVNFEVNDYDISYISYNMNDYLDGSDSTSLGVVGIAATTKYVTSGSTGPSNILTIPKTNRSAKILVGVEALNLQDLEFIEFSLVHDGTDIHVLDYGLMSNASSETSSGLGTYHFYYSGPNINLDFTPNVSLAHTSHFYSITVAIGDTTSSGVSTVTLNNTKFSSHYTGIGSTSSPGQNTIASYGNPYSGAYYLISVEDTTNNRYEFLETIVINDKNNAYLVDYAPVRTHIGLGTFGATVSGTDVSFNFTPIPNIDTQVRVFQNALSLVNAGTIDYEIVLNNASIDTGYGLYEGTSKDIRKSFNLTYENEPVFEKEFLGNNSTIVNIINNTFTIPNHFYVTGEEISYSYPDDGVHSPIGIVTSSIAGIGTTDILPNKLYAINLNSSTISVSDTAENALKSISIPIELRNVGIGSFHKFTAKNQNSRCLIAIDNFIQSPIVGSSVTTILASDVETSDSILNFTGITSFFSGELIRIDDEIMRINKTGIADSNLVLVQRPWMGTTLGFHTSGSLIRKIEGDYNIVGNTINFIEAPAGKSPIGTITNRPNDRDYTGITTFSTFNGRTFLRSSVTDTSNEPYSKNYIFDSLSQEFNGITTSYTLTSSSNNVSGFSTGNSIVLIDGIFQQPRRLGAVDIEGAFYLNEVSGISTITFVGTASSTPYDINQSKLPYGGVIVSFGSTGGLGYQPLVSAGGTATISIAGTITSISVGNSGSGYRANESIEVMSEVIETVSAGTTIISINNNNGILNKLSYYNNGFIDIGSKIIDGQIVGFGTTSVTVSTSSTSTSIINSGDSVKIRLTDPKMGIVNVGYATENSESYSVTFVGFTTVIAGNASPNVTIINPGIGFTEPPILVFDQPLSYTNLRLQYSSSSSGVGTEAKVDVIVGQGSSIIDFNIKNYGYGYKPGDILTVPTGGLTGIPLDATVSPSFGEAQIFVDKVYSNKFTSWVVGDLLPIDPLDDLFDGSRKLFPIKVDGQLRTIRAKSGSPIDIQSTLLVFVNDIIQVPGESYIFEGGSVIAFTEAPKPGDTSSILFYRGTADVDVLEVDILESIQVGDDVKLNSNDPFLNQDFRTVTSINATDDISTNPYSGVGISTNELLLRSITWKRQTEDRTINGQVVGKDRIFYEPLIYPTTNIIQNVGVGSTNIFVDNLKTFFDSYKENTLTSYITDIEIISQDEIRSATATATVSVGGTISSITVTDPGIGYTFAPSVTIQRKIGITTANVAIATAFISSGSVTSIGILTSGVGYAQTNSPLVLIESPTSRIERIKNVSYEGDFGTIVGISTTSLVGIPTGIEFTFYVSSDSYVRDSTINSSTITSTGISGIQTGYYFVVRNSNVGYGLTSLRNDLTVIGIGSEFVDNVYQAAKVSIAQTSVTGVGTTNIVKVVVNVSNFNSIGTSFSNGYYGDFSWGKISIPIRKNPTDFYAYAENGISGIETSPVVRRKNPLKYFGYL